MGNYLFKFEEQIFESEEQIFNTELNTNRFNNFQENDENFKNEIVVNDIYKKIIGLSLYNVRIMYPEYKFRVLSVDNNFFSVDQSYLKDRINLNMETKKGIEVISSIHYIG